MFLKCGAREDSWEHFGLQGDQASQSWRKSTLNIHWKDWCWSWNSNTLATWFEELTHWKRPWCWERLKAGEGDDRGWDGWMALPAIWTWVWVSSRSWWWTGKPGVHEVAKSQTGLHDWTTATTAFSQKHGLTCLKRLNMKPYLTLYWVAVARIFLPRNLSGFGCLGWHTVGYALNITVSTKCKCRSPNHQGAHSEMRLLGLY